MIITNSINTIVYKINTLANKIVPLLVVQTLYDNFVGLITLFMFIGFI